MKKTTRKTEIIFITGKGGVGKSVVAAAVALQRASVGKKTLLVELGNQSFFKDFFQLNEVAYQPTPLRPNLDVALWSGSECLREYALHLLKIESLYKLFFQNPVTKTLVNVAPALPELSILGKITSGPPRFVGPTMDYDCLVVDAYATGHFLALIRAPAGMAEAVRFGPMGEQSRSIDAVIRNQEICKYVVVSLPEEMPVIEALEVSSGIEKQTGQKPIQVLNKLIPNLDSATGQGSAEFLSFIESEKVREKDALSQLAKYRTVKLPFVLANNPWTVVESLSQELSGV